MLQLKQQLVDLEERVSDFFKPKGINVKSEFNFIAIEDGQITLVEFKYESGEPVFKKHPVSLQELNYE